MSFVFYPNHEHRCPNLMHCPHIGGAALGYVVSLANENDQRRDWLFRQLDGAREESAAKWRRIVELEERVRQLEAELKAERQKQFKAARPEEEERTSPEVSEGTEAKKRGAPVGHPSVPPTNNLAEQAVRFLVVLRKVTFGSRTRAGARRMGAMLTVIETARRQGRNLIHFLVARLTLPPNEAARAMDARC